MENRWCLTDRSKEDFHSGEYRRRVANCTAWIYRRTEQTCWNPRCGETGLRMSPIMRRMRSVECDWPADGPKLRKRRLLRHVATAWGGTHREASGWHFFQTAPAETSCGWQTATAETRRS